MNAIPRQAGFWWVALFILLLQLGATAVGWGQGAMVITELMYHPVSEHDADEFLEVYNASNEAIDLDGWSLAGGVRYTFNRHLLFPNDYLVVAADPARFQTSYPGVTNRVGGWLGHLSNQGETIVLRDPQGRVIDEVPYADEGDWASRVAGPVDHGHRGWVWETEADGGGHSLELRHPDLPGECGQSWLPSQQPGGTPGAGNSVENDQVPPLIQEVSHVPFVPRPDEAVRVTARVLFPLGSLSQRVTACFRQDGLEPVAFSEVALFDDGQHGDGLAGDTVYGGTLPPAPAGEIVEFYLRAEDTQGGWRSWPAPVRESDGAWSQSANLLYQVEDSAESGVAPKYRLVMTARERAELLVIGSQAPDSQSDAQFNATWIGTMSEGAEVRYLTDVRHRGHGSRGRHPNNFRVNFRSDEPWQGVVALNLNGQYSYLQHLGSVVCQRAGLPAATCHAAPLRINGQDPAELGPAHLTYGCYAVTEVLDSAFLERLFPQDSGGQLYRGKAADLTNQQADLRYLGDQVDPYRAVYFKETHQGLDAWTDLIRLCRTLEQAPDGEFAERVSEVLQSQNWLDYFAVMALLDNQETGLHTGYGDDYALYAGVDDSRFWLIPHDLDTILGQGNIPGSLTTPLFNATLIPALDRLLKAPSLAPRYYAALQQQLETTFSPGVFNALADQALRSYVPLAAIENLKRFAAARAAQVYTKIPRRLGVDDPTGFRAGNILLSPHASVSLGGGADVIGTRTLSVGTEPAAWSAWEGRWSLSDYPLGPGFNRLIVRAFDAGRIEQERVLVDVWRNPPVTVPVAGLGQSETVWTAEEGSYRVGPGELVVPVGHRLIISAGTTVIFAEGAGIRIEGLLRVEGTADQPVFLGAEPGSPDRWAGLVFAPGAEGNRLSHCLMSGSGLAGYQLMLDQSDVVVESCEWLDGQGSVMFVRASSLVVQDSTFPMLREGSAIVGEGFPVTGVVDIRGNRFGRGSGSLPVIAWSGPGGKRPQAILEVRDNLFAGGDGFGLWIDSIDAHVEGNVFREFQAGVRVPGVDAGIAVLGEEGASLVLARNVFSANSTGVSVSSGARLRLEHNTLYQCGQVGVRVGIRDGRLSTAGEVRIEGTVFWANHQDIHYETAAGLGGGLAVDRCLLSFPTNYPGVTQFSADPWFLQPGIDFRVKTGSPAAGKGWQGMDLGAVIPAGAGLRRINAATLPADEAQFVVYGAGLRGYRFRVDELAFGGEAPRLQVLHLHGLTPGAHQLEVEGIDSAGRPVVALHPEGTYPFTVLGGEGGVLINELLADNASIELSAGYTPDLIELHNPGRETMDLGGMGLTDDPGDPWKFQFAPGTTIRSGDYLVCLGDSQSGAPGLHIGFGLSRTGEGVYLFEHPDRGGRLLDAVVFGIQLADRSIGRTAVGGWQLNWPSFGRANTECPISSPAGLKINEWLAATRVLNEDDFTEIYNPHPFPVHLGGCALSDRPLSQPDRYRIPQLSFIDAGGWTVFEADGNPGRGADHLNFRLSASGGHLTFRGPDGTILDEVVYGPQVVDQTEGRTPDGSVRIEPLIHVTPGQANPVPEVLHRPSRAKLVALDSHWRYHAEGIDLGSAWAALDYDDSGADWHLGDGLFYANFVNLPGALGTPVSLGVTLPTTVYFRTLFSQFGSGEVRSLDLYHVVDDGMVVYLNGERLYDYNVSGWPLTFADYATRTIGSPPAMGPITVPSRLLRDGVNVLAVEIHQAGPESSDLAFGLALEANGVTSEPFPSNEHVQEIAGDWMTESAVWSPADGEIQLRADVVVPAPHQLIIQAGTVLRLAPGVSLRTYGGRIDFRGTAENPIRVRPMSEGQSWGSLSAQGDTGFLGLEQVDLSGGQLSFLQGATGVIVDCHLHDYLAGDNPMIVSDAAQSLALIRCHIERFHELDLTATPLTIEGCLLEAPHADAIDLDLAPPATLIRNTLIRGGVGVNTDAIDFGSGSQGTVESCLIHDMPDKAISVGEGSRNVMILNNLLHRVDIGIGVTEFASATVAQNTVVDARVGLRLSEKIAGQGGGLVAGWNNILWGNGIAVETGANASLELSHSIVSPELAAPEKGLVSINPDFRDPFGADYRLSPDSPAWVLGQDGGALGVRGTLGGRPATPWGLSAAWVGPQTAQVSWTQTVFSGFGFLIERAVDHGAWEVLARVSGDFAGYIDDEVVPGVPLNYRVREQGKWQDSFPSEPVTMLGWFDQDNDSLPDFWEESYRLDPGFAPDADEDADGDGLSNLGEFFAGTDPRDRLSQVGLVSQRHQNAGGGVALSFVAQPGRVYVVEWLPELGLDWRVCTVIPAATEASLVDLELWVSEEQTAFFRLGIPLEE